ncbi:ATP-binding cassette domain-containing protein [Rickettsia amblyommatis]|uniref:ABC transporter family protein n=1 Tax=Rickettsia amblyommatis str. Ac/Pa TaxID=1359164 RepID=A0A0F3N4Y8_RICAM|nr:ATP-binding cassette domain-containing protein [Rickettsia amblyommatis]ALA61706.1 methionine ABC transporter ATP-binding protein [Rickettsia amblyommatis]KJV61974.1 ABC transporter family protein [Rickettsia amblyommatis str. Ac/Pa]
MKPYLYAENIQFKVKERTEPIIVETTLNIAKEEFVVILGHNGSGKSTLAKILAGYLKPTSGKVCLDQVRIDKIPKGQKASTLVTLTQKAEERLFTELTLEENIILWESRFSSNERLTSSELLELTGSPKRFLPLLAQPLGKFSGGEKQIILLALSIAHPPKILFLDEHTANLDPKASLEVMKKTAEIIEKHKITSVMITHNLEDAVNYGERLIVLDSGKVVLDYLKPPGFSLKELKEILN